MTDLFSQSACRPQKEQIYPDVFVLPQFADTEQLIAETLKIIKISPFRKMLTPNGYHTGVSLTNCGEYGWVSDIHGYRYSTIDPLTGKSWEPIPQIFSVLAQKAAESAGYSMFVPDACLINRYTIGTGLGSHQDKNEKNFLWPIVSVSIGLPAVFQIFGHKRSGCQKQYLLQNGDVMVWGNNSRLIYHGVKPLVEDKLRPDKIERINLTFRKAF